jgi:hypothetical protein
MKKLFFIALCLISTVTFGQNIKVDAAGNYVAIHKAKDTTLISTGKTFTDSKGNVWPVYKTSAGRIYALRVSKSGNKYKQYLDKP